MADVAPQEAEMGVEKKPFHFTFRLDDGTVIRPGKGDGVEVLRPEDAWKAGLLNESHLLRMQALLCEVHAKLPEEGPLKSISLGSKRSMDSVLEVGHTMSAKKSRSVGDGPVAAAPSFAPSPPPPANQSTQPLQSNWTAMCQKIVDFLISQVLGVDAYIFRDPVNPAVVTDYYEKIANPICLKQITERLRNGDYSGPEGFYNDMLLLCDNCYKYNVETYPSNIGLLGVKMENAFLGAWSKTPFSATVPPRPFRHPPPIRNHRQPVKKTPTMSAVRSSGAQKSRAARGRPGRPPVARTKSVNSYGAMAVYTPEMQAQLVAALNDSAVLEANMEGVVAILNQAGEMGVDEEGEATLDLEKVTPPTALKLYDLVVVKTGRAGLHAPQQPQNMEDDDWDPDEEFDE